MQIGNLCIIAACLAAQFPWPSQPTAPLPPVACADLPANIVVQAPLRHLVDEMWQRAPTFRRQIARLAPERTLVVTISIYCPNCSAHVRARTRLIRVNSSLRSADIEIQRLDAPAVVELVAHEIEHILEQLDGVDLTRWSGRSGVYRIGGKTLAAHFETERSRRVGAAVANEYAAAAVIGAPCTERRQ